MAYRIGIEVGAANTTWATVSRELSGAERVDGGTVESIAGVIDGNLVVGAEAADVARLQEPTRGFVDRLGESEAIVLGGTPYGVETLVGRLISSVIRTATDRLGAAPGAVVIVHDDSLDEFRVGLLTEAARVAGVSMADVVMVSRSEARAAAPSPASPTGLETVTGASMLGWVRRPAPLAASGTVGIGATEVGIAATGAAAGAAGTAAVAATGLGDGVATANAAMAPPAGPAGTPLGAPTGAGPAGSPLTPPAGPAGTPLTPPAGPAGTPLTPTAGPTGTALPGPAAGPGGTPLAPTSSGSSVVGRALRPRRLPIIIGASVAAVAVVAVVVVAVNDDDPPSTAPAPTVVTDSSATSDSSAVDTTAAADTVPVVEEASRCVQGQWTMRNESFAAFFSGMMAGAGGGEIVATGVSGSVSIDVAEDGTWTLTYETWTLTASLPSVGGEMSVTIDGVDVSTGTFQDDGTYSFSGVSMGTTITSSAVIDGVAVPIPPIDRSSQVVDGSGSFTCAGDELTLTVPESGGSFTMDRTG
ncbi:MAG: hypothetical protein HY828_21335 [Actinobacteria bacterium]|nr:hypothetical protein [Actinomycetota bacterium]